MAKAKELEAAQQEKGEPTKPTCGIIMPIAALHDYTVDHWLRVKAVLERAIDAAGYTPRIVSESNEVGIIHSHIVQNIYDDEIVVVDVSGKNPNVMFELGLRLAFDKPAIIVKDDDTDYSFDTSPIKHIPYRRDQRFDDVEDFVRVVSRHITATVEKAKDKDFSPFLKHFGTLTPKKVEGKEISEADFIVAKINSLEREIRRMNRFNELPRSGTSWFEKLNDTASGATISVRAQEEIKQALIAVAATLEPGSHMSDSELQIAVEKYLKSVGNEMPLMLFETAYKKVMSRSKLDDFNEGPFK